MGVAGRDRARPQPVATSDQSIASADTSINVLLISADAAKGADVADIVTLTDIYTRLLERYFDRPPV